MKNVIKWIGAVNRKYDTQYDMEVCDITQRITRKQFKYFKIKILSEVFRLTCKSIDAYPCLNMWTGTLDLFKLEDKLN